MRKDDLLLYAVTNRRWTDRQTLPEQIEAALQGGATMVQLREKDLPEDDFLAEAVRVRDLCRRYGVPLIINDSVTVALNSGADGVHVGMEDMPPEEIRRLVPAGFIIGVTAKTVEQARAAQTAGADYLGVGAVFPSSTKKNALGITTRELREICESVAIPAVAIGGVGPENVLRLKGCGMAGIAVVSAVFGAPDIRAAAEELKKLAREAVEP